MHLEWPVPLDVPDQPWMLKRNGTLTREATPLSWVWSFPCLMVSAQLPVSLGVSSPFWPEHAGICSPAPTKGYRGAGDGDYMFHNTLLFLQLCSIGSLPLPIGKQGI